MSPKITIVPPNTRWTEHVTELFSLIANVSKDDVVVDPCAGTGGFLISAMMRMAATATTQAELDSIKRDRLIGVEQQATMYALAASNMILRGDGKTNLHQGSCFDSAITKAVKGHKPTVGLVNPPYAKSKADLAELRFVEHMLDTLEKGGIGVAIVPVSCATAPSIHKVNLLKKHTLEAVMSMPPEIFHPVGVVTCVWDIHLTGVESVAAAEARRSSMAGSLRGGPSSARVPSRALQGPGAASWRRGGPGT